VALPDAVTIGAHRRALRRIAEGGRPKPAYDLPVYIIGTEVPIPGGAMEALDHLEVTTPGAAHRDRRDSSRGLSPRSDLQDAFARAIGVVVQPGVEFGNENVVVLRQPRAARRLSERPQANARNSSSRPHSTDYQPRSALSASGSRRLRRSSRSGRGLTFALREALYGLDADRRLPRTACRRGNPARQDGAAVAGRAGRTGRNITTATRTELRLQRHFSYSATASATTGRIRRHRLPSTSW
jgi:D-tagatose-1,6-bisphosphate aldolase subunit GatZ/KbaZ